MIKKVLIANRGEIAVRIHRACRDMGIHTVAIHSTADSDALHVKMANESVCIGGPTVTESYLNMPAVIAAAEVTGADAIHPGYGFLSENAKFAQMVAESGFTFIGPDPEHITLMGDKIEALKFAEKSGLPTIPGSGGPVESSDTAIEIAAKIGYPVIIKAAAGGGGRGMKVVYDEASMKELLEVTMAEAKAAFGDGRVFIEKYLEKPRHIEVQVLADKHGNVVHLGERECTLQRRHQKVLEESPSPTLNDEERQHVFDVSINACKALNYVGVGTMEFLYEKGEFYFIEMNTRLQVEHPVTEQVTGLDLVRQQLLVASGEKLEMDKLSNVKARGHSIECRVNAENPENFLPSPGTVTDYFTPGGPGVRIDACLYPDCKVPPYYDPMVAKVISYGNTREQAIKRMRRAVEEYIIGGINTTLPLHQRILENESFIKGDFDVNSLERFIQGGQF